MGYEVHEDRLNSSLPVFGGCGDDVVEKVFESIGGGVRFLALGGCGNI